MAALRSAARARPRAAARRRLGGTAAQRPIAALAHARWPWWRWCWWPSWPLPLRPSCCRRAGREGRFVGLANFIAYAQTPALLDSLWNSLWVSAAGHAAGRARGLCLCLCADAQPHALQAAVPRHHAGAAAGAQSLLSAISLIYWFGNQGVLKELAAGAGHGPDLRRAGHRGGRDLCGLSACADDPGHRAHRADARLYEAADAMGTTAARKFFTITLPGAKYGLISASLVVFTLVITDFGIPKVIGGNFNVLATDVFKLVIGQQDFQRARWWRCCCWRRRC
jgi:iron(III) transport system permease protein